MHCNLAAADNAITNIWTGDWYKRTLRAEKERLGHQHVRLLVNCVFVDGTQVNRQGSREAVPIIQALLNYTQEQLASDASKKLYGFYPDVHLSKEQKQDKDIQEFMRDLHGAVTTSYLDGILELYEQGGMRWGDSTGVVWHLVPVIAFMATDMKEARMQKGLYNAWNCKMPCNLCLWPFEAADVPLSPEEMEYWSQDDVLSAVDELDQATRHVANALSITDRPTVT